MKHTEILLLGAGIGGLTASIALARRGFQVHLFEQADALRALGAGLTLQINAMLVLAQLGLSKTVQEASMPTDHFLLRDERGHTIQSTAFADIAQSWGVPMVAIHRARLMTLLADKAKALGVHIHLGKQALRFDEKDGEVTLHFKDGTQHTGTVLVGCDGLWSKVRQTLHGHEPLRYAGYTCWRGIAQMPAPTTSSESWGAGKRFGLIPIHPDEVYWFAVADAPEGQQDGKNPLSKLRKNFESWPQDVQDALTHTAPHSLLRHDCHDRGPNARWGKGSVTLLGDASHPMLPNMGQGACQAIEDAYALAQALDAHRDQPSQGLRHYEQSRQQRTNTFITRSWTFGRVAHATRSTPLRRLRDTCMRLIPSRAMKSSLTTLYGNGPAPQIANS